MFKLISVTNRKLCCEDFLTRIERVAASGVDGVILREKDLSAEDYLALARQVTEVCRKQGTPCFLHTYAQEALDLDVKFIHLPLNVLKGIDKIKRDQFRALGASCHSLEDVRKAEELGCTYVTLGHIFATDCKPGLPPRGIELLRSVCSASSIPVYAIGGISPENAAACREAGAAGVCVMSGLMCCDDPAEYVRRFREALI